MVWVGDRVMVSLSMYNAEDELWYAELLVVVVPISDGLAVAVLAVALEPLAMIEG